MPVKRLGIANPTANSVTLLCTADTTGVLSVIASNKGALSTAVSIWISPIDTANDPGSRAYIVSNLSVATGQAFETFRFGVNAGDNIYVTADGANASFSANLLYETASRQSVVYQASQPGSPQVGDIWIDSDDNSVRLYNGSAFVLIATTAPIGATDDTPTPPPTPPPPPPPPPKLNGLFEESDEEAESE